MRMIMQTTEILEGNCAGWHARATGMPGPTTFVQICEKWEKKKKLIKSLCWMRAVERVSGDASVRWWVIPAHKYILHISGNSIQLNHFFKLNLIGRRQRYFHLNVDDLRRAWEGDAGRCHAKEIARRTVLHFQWKFYLFGAGGIVGIALTAFTATHFSHTFGWLREDMRLTCIAFKFVLPVH